MDDPRVAIRHHALRLGGTLVIRIPFSTSGRFVLAAIEYKPQHPEISLRCAALAILSVQPCHSKAFHALLSRMILIAGEYIISTKDKSGGGDVLATPRAQAALDAAKDMTAVALMLLCAATDSAGPDSLDTRLSHKLCSLLAMNPSSPAATDICARAMQSNFPSLETDPRLSALAALAMELSLRVDSAPMSARRRASITRALSDPPPASPPSSPPIPHQQCVPAISSTISLHPTIDQPVPKVACRPAISIMIPSSPAVGAARHLHDGGRDTNTPVTIEYPSEEGEGSYLPSWTPQADGEGYSSLASPWAIRQETPTGEMDRTKLRSIKRGGRKPGSRLRARTADESTTHSEEWEKGSSMGIPSTAGGRLTGGVALNDVNDVAGVHEANIELGPNTPTASGLSVGDGRKVPMTDNRLRSHLPPKTFSNGMRRRSRTEGDPDSVFGTPHRVLNPMDSTQLSCDENDEDADLTHTMTASDSVAGAKVELGGGRCKPSSTDMSDSIPMKAVKVHSVKSQQNTFHIKGNSVFGGANMGTDCTADLPPSSNSAPRHPRRPPPITSLTQSDHSNSNHQVDLVSSDADPSAPSPLAAASQDSFDYLATEDLQPCERPKKDISQVVSGLFQHDWPEIFYTLNTVRQLAVHHQNELIKSGQLHQIVLGVNKQVCSVPICLKHILVMSRIIG